MSRMRAIFLLLLALPLTGCYADQKKQLAACEVNAARQFPRPVPGQPFKAVKDCMSAAGYRFIGWNTGIVCDMGAVVRGKPSATGTDALCFEPAGWLARRIYRIEVPLRSAPAASS